ncbi:MAG TPA: type VI secretion system tip protein VgrG, partial [Erwinia sp.]|nr:type VI secretion system tip protein VgrG [Erwinia sp.]
SKDGTPDNANALRFEDKAGEEQVWIQAQKNMDTNIKNDETRAVGGYSSLKVERDYSTKIFGSCFNTTQCEHYELVGWDYTVRSDGRMQLASSKSISLVSGDSMLTLDANGTVSIQCKNFQINASEQGQINTGGTLDLNMTQPAKAPSPSPTPKDISSELEKELNDKGSEA